VSREGSTTRGNYIKDPELKLTAEVTKVIKATQARIRYANRKEEKAMAKRRKEQPSLPFPGKSFAAPASMSSKSLQQLGLWLGKL
jgi:hypothetical protein